MYLIKWVIQKIFDHDSRAKPNVEARLHVPHGILLDDEGNWLTACYSDPESRLVERRVKPDEQEETDAITYWRSKELKGPSAIAMKRDQTLIVANRDDNSLCFFKQQSTDKEAKN
jgi:hypothetical protein